MVLKIILILVLCIAIYFDIKYLKLINRIIKYNVFIDYKNNRIKHCMLNDREILFKVYQKFEEYVHEKRTNDNDNNDSLYKLNEDFIYMTKTFDDDFKMIIEYSDEINNSINDFNQYISNKI